MLGRNFKILIIILVYQIHKYETARTEEVYSLDLRPRIDYFFFCLQYVVLES